MPNDGFINENQMIEAINCKKFCDLNSNLKEFCSFLFNDISFAENDIIYAKKSDIPFSKTDVVISFNGLNKNISIKKGSGNSVHQESFNSFIEYLNENNISENYINDLKLFHYGDGSIDDTGAVRLSANQCKKVYQNEILNINAIFNSNDLLVKLLERFIFKGNVDNGIYVDYIYYGSINKGLWITREELLSYFINNTFKSDSVHIASLTYQVWGRDNNFKAVHPNRRYIMQIKWGQLEKDLIKIISERNN